MLPKVSFPVHLAALNLLIVHVQTKVPVNFPVNTETYLLQTCLNEIPPDFPFTVQRVKILDAEMTYVDPYCTNTTFSTATGCALPPQQPNFFVPVAEHNPPCH